MYLCLKMTSELYQSEEYGLEKEPYMLSSYVSSVPQVKHISFDTLLFSNLLMEPI